jgi:hypothetical protein
VCVPLQVGEVGAGQKLSKLCDLVMRGFQEAGLLLKVSVSGGGGGGRRVRGSCCVAVAADAAAAVNAKHCVSCYWM